MFFRKPFFGYGGHEIALKPFFRKFDGWWYAQIQRGEKRRQIKLVKGKENQKEAYRIFCRVMAEEETYVAKDHSQSVAVICDFFLEDSLKKHSARTFAWHK